MVVTQRSSVGTQSCGEGGGVVGLNSSPLCHSSPVSPLWPRTVTHCQLLHQAENRPERRDQSGRGESPRLRPRCRTWQVLTCLPCPDSFGNGPEATAAVRRVAEHEWIDPVLAVQHGSGAAAGSFSGRKSPFTPSLNPHVVSSLYTCRRHFECTEVKLRFYFVDQNRLSDSL